jgi:FkbM family methyltransferase
MKGAKAFLKAATPPFLWETGSAVVANRRHREREKRVKVGRFEILVPDESLLSRLGNEQPYRNLAIGVIAKFAGERDAGAVIIDVGANVGGTAAMIASHCRNPLVLVEPSAHYLGYLTQNAALFPNECRFVRGIITDGRVASPTLEHNGGSARVVEGAAAPDPDVLQLRLDQVQREGVALVKIDADGWDFKIILDSTAWLARQRPILYYEAEVDSLEDLRLANQVVERCSEIGYRLAIVWDDAGCCMCATDHLETIGDLHRYLLECRRQQSRQGLYSYNVALFHEKDTQIYDRVARYFRSGQPLQAGNSGIDD